MNAQANVIPLRRGKPLWSSPHGRIGEIEKIVCSIDSLTDGAHRVFTAIIRRVNVETGEFFCGDEVMIRFARAGSRKSLFRYRKMLVDLGLLEIVPGRPGHVTLYRLAITDDEIAAGAAALDEMARDGRAEAAELRAARPAPEMMKKTPPTEVGIGERHLNIVSNLVEPRSLKCPTNLPVPSPPSSHSEKTERYIGRGEGFSRREERWPEPHRFSPRQAKAWKPETRDQALTAIRNDARSATTIGGGREDLMLRRLDLLPDQALIMVAESLQTGKGYEILVDCLNAALDAEREIAKQDGKEVR